MIKKPLSYKIYDYTKAGIDIPDQRMGSYTTKYKTRKWTLHLMEKSINQLKIQWAK